MEFSFENIVRCVVRTAHRFNDEHMSGNPVWFAVAERCGVGSTSAIALCRRFGVDPEQIIEKTRWEKVAELCGKEMDDLDQGPSETCCKMWQHIEDNAPPM